MNTWEIRTGVFNRGLVGGQGVIWGGITNTEEGLKSYMETWYC